MTKFIDDNQQIETELQEAVINAVSDVLDYIKERKTIVHHNHETASCFEIPKIC